MGPIISAEIEEKISRDDHGNISVKEVNECFSNHNGRYCTEHRAEHLPESGAPSLWFVAATNHGRELKVMFVFGRRKDLPQICIPCHDESQRNFRTARTLAHMLDR